MSFVGTLLANDLNKLFKSAYIPFVLSEDQLVFWTNGEPRIAKILVQDDGNVRLDRLGVDRKLETSYLACGDPELSDKVREWVSNHLMLS